MENSEIVNMLSIDVEDYFQVSAFEQISPPSTWEQFESRVERNTDKILAILDEANVQATFFILGWVARLLPALITKIGAMGHEVASHGYGHQRLQNQTRQEFRDDIRKSKAILEDIVGVSVNGYRAPSYSICHDSLWAFDELVDAGYLYDSSVFPVRHDFYGIADWPRFTFSLQRDEAKGWVPAARKSAAGEIVEIPITTLSMAGRNVPIAGGGYFRLYPYVMTRKGLQEINERENQPFIFYIHPWEFDPQQPRMKNAGFKSCFRHYLNLNRTEERFSQLVQDFRFASISRVLEAVERPDCSVGSRLLH